MNPKTDYEGVSVFNYGSSSVDLTGYSISDGEGTITFSEKIVVKPGERATIAKSADSSDLFTSRSDVYVIGEHGISATKFALNDSGDDIYLIKGSVTIDAVCYGKTVISDESMWIGESVSIGSRFVQRMGTYDHDTASDWTVYGGTNFLFDPDQLYDAVVTPFVFPEHGGIPVYRALEAATESVDIEIYMLTYKNVYALLCDLEKKGVEVRLLLEGKPLGYSVTDYAPYVRTLADAGGEIRLIGDVSGDRFDYVHAKYAVIDRSIVIITSENWTADNLNGKVAEDPYASGVKGNRGWGAIVESTEYAEFMTSVFENDFSKEYGDVVDFLDKYPKSVPTEISYTSPKSSLVLDSYSATVTPVLSNDSSYDALEYYISNSTTRVYSENQSLGGKYMDLNPGSPVKMMADAADNGADARFILSSGASDADPQVYLINSSSGVQAATMSTPYLHNKGMVCDDNAWISSINWTPNSVENNRETGVVVHSHDVAEFFAEYFLKDFDRYYDFDGFKVEFTEIQDTYRAGTEITVAVEVTPAGDYTYKWDLGDGSAPITTTVSRAALSPADGTHTLKVTVSDGERSVTISHKYTMETSEPLEFDKRILYIAIVVLIIIAAGAAMRRKH